MNWIPAITTTTIFMAALWLARNLILTRLKAAVEHEFGVKLEQLRSDLRSGEEALRAERAAREREVDALRSGTLATMSGRQAALDKRQLEAVDQLWSTVISLGKSRSLATMLSVLNLEAIGREVQSNEKVRSFVEMLGLGFDQKSMDLSGASMARPFLSPVVWASYSALLAVCSHAAILWTALKSGLDTRGITDEVAIGKLIKAALPEHSQLIDERGTVAAYQLTEALETQLIQQISAMLRGDDVDKASIERAAEITHYASTLMANKASLTTNGA